MRWHKDGCTQGTETMRHDLRHASRSVSNMGLPAILNDRLYAHWRQLYDDAVRHTQLIRGRHGVLIEVAAQHPLVDGLRPNAEFAARLNAAADLYHALADGQDDAMNLPIRIYVPGSRHMSDADIADSITLSEAGCAFLFGSCGIPSDALIGDEANRKYKGDAGVYNSSDECYVVSRLLDDLGYGRLMCVCSPAQLMRKALSYVQFSIVPDMHAVPVDAMYHDYVDEAFLYIPRLLADGSGLQDAGSAEAARLRKARRPHDGI